MTDGQQLTPQHAPTGSEEGETSKVYSLVPSWPLLRKKALTGVMAIALAIAFYFLYHRYWHNPDVINKDIEEQYNNAVRDFGMSPVYPPREDFRVGDLFFTAFGKDGLAVARIWVGRMEQVATQADSYAASFRKKKTTSSSNIEKSPEAASKKDSPTEDIWLESLPIVSLPSITGSSSGAAYFGGQTPYVAGIMSDDMTRFVSVDFPNVRAHGFPAGAVTLNLDFLNQFRAETCKHVYYAHELLESAVAEKNMTCNPKLAEKLLGSRDERPLLSCRLELVTRVFLTDKINFTYGIRNGNRLSAGKDNESLKILDSPAVTVQVDNEGKQTVTFGSNKTSDATNDPLPKDSPLASLSIAGESNNGLIFSKEFDHPVTIGFDSIAPSYMGWNQCSE